MKKKVMAAVLAGVLALLGVVVLLLWAKKADERAYEGAELISVVRVTQEVAKGTPSAELSSMTEVTKVPVSTVPSGAVTDLAEVSGRVTATTLQPGEVLLRSRMVDPGAKGDSDVSVPKGMQEVTFTIDGSRAVGNAVQAGDKVGVFGSYDPEQGDSWTNLVSHDVLVTKVGKGVTDGDAVTTTTVTVAVKTELAEKIIFTMEFGKVWLSLQNADTERRGEVVITGEDLQ